MKALLSIGKAARRLGLSVDTVRELERNGELKAERTPGGHRRFKPEVLDAYLAQRSRPRSKRRPTTALPQPARRRKRMRGAKNEPPDLPPPDGWDEEPFEPPPRLPAQAAPKSQQELLLEQVRQTTERFVEESRLNSLKSHGQSHIPWGASATARSAVIEALAEYVKARRFPASMPFWEARQAVEAKVAAIMEPFNAAAAREAARKAEADAKRKELEREEQRLRSLIEHGKSRAVMHTIGWDPEDKQEARADVEEALSDEVEADWSERDVDELVDDALEESDEEEDDWGRKHGR